MSDSDELRMIRRMDDQQQGLIAHEQRITQVETRMTTLEIKFPYLDNAITKLTSIVEMQSKQGSLTEQAVVALKEGQEQHSRNIEELTKGHERTKTRLDGLRGVLAAIGTAFLLAGAGYVFSIFAQHPLK